MKDDGTLITLKRINEHIAELTTTNDTPALTITAQGDGRMYAFGVTNRPRFLHA